MPAPPERISCLMVTQPCPERFELLRRSVSCFLSQTYPERELVVVLDEGPAESVARLRSYLAEVPARTVVVQPEGKFPLGALRNRSIVAATGAVLCQWDDDDLWHPTRLARQYAALQQENALGVALQDFLHFFPVRRELYWITFRRTVDQCHAGTILFRSGLAARCPEEGPNSRRDEDSAFLAALRREGRVVTLPEAAHLYVYVYHGHNLSGTWQHTEIARVLSLSRRRMELKRSVLERELACLDLGTYPVKVMGYNGEAFEIHAGDSSPSGP